jgi:ABC-2 type transport system permease protein
VSWVAVAKSEIADGNTRSCLWLALLTVVITGFITWEQSLLRESIDSELSDSTLVVLESTDVGAMAILGMAFGYWAVFGTDGSTTVEELCSLPYASAELIGGKFLGRMALLAVIVLANYLTAGVVAGMKHGPFSLRVFVPSLCIALIAVAIHVAIGMGVSLVVQSRPYAFAVLFAVFWWYLFFQTIALFLLEQFAAGFSGWAVLIVLIQPGGAIGFTRRALVPEVPIDSSFDATAFFLLDWVAIIVAICWIVFTLWAGQRRLNAVGAE